MRIDPHPLGVAEQPSDPLASARPVPLRVRVQLAHAALNLAPSPQVIDLLHIKGAASDSSLGRGGRGGTDADLLVRPGQAIAYLESLAAAQWSSLTSFESDSDFGSSTTLWHDLWGLADVHRFFPGIGAPPEVAFEVLWCDRQIREIAGIPCWVPSVPAQAVILVLNAARSMGAGKHDVESAWETASPQRRRRMMEIVTDLQAEVAFAAGIGELERFRGSREYDLWRIESQGGTRIARWRARIKAAPTVAEKSRLALLAPLVNVDHLTVLLGHRPSRAEIAREFFARPARGVREEARAFVRRLGIREGPR